MDLSLFIINALAIGYVCLLPFIFFRADGSFNILWLLTAAPYVTYELFLLGVYTGHLNTFSISGELTTLATICSVVLCVLGISLISMTIGSHRVPLALWHQKNDAPVNIVKHGPYSKVRHPFYTSFIVIMIGSAIAFPHVISIAITTYGISVLTLTAMKEEKKLSICEFGQEYQEYMKSTGRFFPKLG